MNVLKAYSILFGMSLLLFSFSNCGSSQSTSNGIQENRPPFVVANSYYQEWVAGVQEGGKGIKVYFELESVEPGVTFNTIYFRGNAADITYLPQSKFKFMADIRTDTKRPDVIMDSDAANEAANKPPVIMPLEIPDTHAALSYTYKGNTKTFVLENIEEKEAIAYPSNNPKGDN
ncbi:MAG TPA: hypothetical protein EYN07_07035 [Flavobacteriaceae bacterium]|nr:hypothetical protein [Flavobacteriaceae bacterium]HIN98980.1 hypothetical protein [Flavobacteriaceae bacterium]